MEFKIDLINIFILFVMLINSIYGLIVYSGNRKDKINYLFFILTVSISLWGLTMFGYRGFTDHDHVLLMSRLLYFAAITIPITFIYFALIFPNPKTELTKFQKYFAPIPAIILAIISLLPNIFIKDVILYSGKETFIVFNHTAHILFGIYVVSYFSWAYLIIIKKFLKAKDALKKQLGFVFLGTLASTMVTLTTNMALLYLGYFALNWVGQISIIFMITAIFYSILKFKLFNIKIIATEIFVFTLWLFMLVRFFLAETNQDKIVSAILVLLISIIGILLIRSVIKEVKQREHIEKLAADLTDANTRLKELDKQKSEFVSFATHQLRAPLTAMKGYSSLILEGDMGKLEPAMKEAVSRIYDSSKTLANIVDDYLNISRIELGTMVYAFSPLDLKAMVKDVIAELRPNIEKTGIKFSFTTVPSGDKEHFDVKADRDKLKQVIANLIDNSLKYTPSGSIEVALTKNNEIHKIIFSVKDTGVGIAPEVMPKLFAKFVRAGNANKQNIYGTGLGLFVVKEIVTAHKGRVWAESKGEGKGSTFYMEIDTAI